MIHPTKRTPLRALVLALAFTALAVVAPGAARAHSTTEYVSLYTPLVGSSAWARTPGTEPANHHIVFSNWGYRNDWSVDLYAPAGSRVVSPFGSKASNGQPMTIRVVSVRAGCASGSIADGGYVMTIEATNASTGVVLGRADLMHVASPQVGAGAVIGPWTTLGYTSQFRNSNCYQVSTASGVHVHAEFINNHRYSCYIWRTNNAAINENTVIGRVGVHYGGQRAAC